MQKPHKTPLSKAVQFRLTEELLTKLARLKSIIEANSPKQATVNQSALLRECIRIGLCQMEEEWEKNEQGT
jgi:hypothetical protein